MKGKAPKAVLTDQDATMCAAIRDVFPKATHRLCCWHISCNAETNIKIPGFSTCFSKLMKITCSVAQFEARWSTLIAKFGVADHPWIQDIYSKRHLWAEAFFRGKFFSMTRITQRAESMNASLKHKVSSGFSLTDLFRQYNNSFLKRIRKRFHVLQKESENPPKEVKRTGLLSGLENHAGRVCTRAIFDYIQNELKEEANIIVLNKSVPVNRRHTFIFEDHSKARPRTFTTVIDLDNEEFHLICGFKNLTLTKFPAKSDNEEPIENFKHVPHVGDPAKIVPKGGSKDKKHLCGLCMLMKPGHKTTTCEQNPDSRARANAKHSARINPLENAGYGNAVTEDSFVESIHKFVMIFIIHIQKFCRWDPFTCL
ncbi:PREDICTED: protein FAR1-RELATED SEQUENCE 5-like [Erythranthe guttata]|uniref:protein FAR1-RELATED SEQUENCE 5-like n=1 Tax=Erythranthe guttata TaxID=4155 RepID=UPI00064D7556|nr:PREDICTED: protein FAR1-RELATED SEQUENCE 5-like [Erythranthe guttata]|eukprot:XP_012833686.1 PREDICTED: protein FAR1-RELATED SEQUENCE 5-like [Erythranthe guttata]